MNPVNIKVSVNVKQKLDALPKEKCDKHMCKMNRAVDKILKANANQKKMVKINTLGLSKKLIKHLITEAIPYVGMKIIKIIPGMLAIFL